METQNNTLEVEAKEYPQFGISFKIGDDGNTWLFKDCCERREMIDELEKWMKTQDDIKYHTFDIPACPCCVAESEVKE